MTDPIIRVSDMAFPRFQAPDLDRMEAFLTDFGMQRSARTERALYMRGTDAQHHVHVTHLGERGVPRSRLPRRRAAPTCARWPRAVGGAVEPLDEPGGGEVVRLRDPDGRQIDVVHGIAELAAACRARASAAQHRRRPGARRDAATGRSRARRR